MKTAALALIKRDMRLALKQGGGFGAALGFILAVMVLVPLAVGPDQAQLQRLAPGMMWLALLLAVLLTADRMFQQDFEDGSLDVMSMGRLPFEVVTLLKALAHWLTVSLPLALITPPMGLFLNIYTGQLPILYAIWQRQNKKKYTIPGIKFVKQRSYPLFVDKMSIFCI